MGIADDDGRSRRAGNSNLMALLAVLIVELIVVGAVCVATVHFHHPHLSH